ncbi:MAG TPA: aminotransferase class I/II-fold pyridoxal phosphate-dependent enzyme, partial [Spirochaetia bacterium]|nr:aminotransferase class I/II-fold pyridoxal phosphate-dependent enzyme [Spirochaetia bacterium]
MAYDFTTIPDRRGTHSLKWDNVLPGTESAQALEPVPLWVADMDFAAPPAALAALAARVARPIFGYTNLPSGYFETVAAWNARRYGRTWEPRHFLAAPSVLHGLSMAIRTFTAPGDRILNLPPVYFPFFKAAQLNGREIFDVPLVRRDRWEMDFDVLETALTRAKAEGKPVKALLFSAPQNPTGRVWTRSELEALGALARKHDFLLFSDEIHADLVLPGHRHLGPLDLPELTDRTLVFAGPNKTFNLAGLPISHVVALDDGLRTKMKRAIEADFYDQPNVLSLAAAWASYREGEAWLEELLGVIADHKGVLDRFLDTLNRDWSPEPRLRSEPLEATYLAWVDVTGLVRRFGFEDDRDLGLFLEKTVRVKMTTGSTFQTGGRNHLRFNLA